VIQAVRIGDLAIVGIPGEPTSVLGNQIKAAGLKMGFKTVLVCSHVNGWMGYVLDPADYDQGEYEATLSFYGREEGPKLVKAAVAALGKLR
jgi:neutral ceramidase